MIAALVILNHGYNVYTARWRRVLNPEEPSDSEPWTASESELVSVKANAEATSTNSQSHRGPKAKAQ